ncbi:MAG: FAD-dependent oxidoreductase [Nodosilinea sp.]
MVQKNFKEPDMEDVVVIGAGVSGLAAARALHQSGYQVAVVDKSRGLGGRLATRRRNDAVIDHGCRYLEPFTNSSLSPIAELVASGTLQPWQPKAFELGADGALSAVAASAVYAAPEGMSSVAKNLAQGLTIHRHWRAIAITPLAHGWRVEAARGDSHRQSNTLEAKAVVVAIPAPQIADLLQASSEYKGVKALLKQLDLVSFDAVITVMAGYRSSDPASLLAQLDSQGWIIASSTHPALRWAALDSSKRARQQEPVAVFHSSPEFAASASDKSDLEPVGQALLAAIAPCGEWLLSPQWMQVHRWRYGFVRQALGSTILSSALLPNLIGCGDWCSGGHVEGAIASGRRAAAAAADFLSQQKRHN